MDGRAFHGTRRARVALDARLDANPQTWNDTPGRTLDEVRWLLTSTADALAADA